MAIPKNEKGLCGAYVNINGSPLSFNKYGIPLLIPPYSIFPTYYSAFSLPDLMVSTAGETINNYNPGESDTCLGDIHYLQTE